MKKIRKHPARIHVINRPEIDSKSEEKLINLSELREEFSFKWRVQSYSQYKPQAICVPYIDSRQVQDCLDRVCGSENWQDKYESVGDALYCHVGIKINGEWVWKSDCGTESNVEKAKGEASDAFKRACVKWGIGRFLYSMRTYPVKANKAKDQQDKKNHLWCVDDKGNKIPDYMITEYINSKRGSKGAVPAADPSAKGNDASAELETLEAWLEKQNVKNIITAMIWLGVDKTLATEIEYKRSGPIGVARAHYGDLCHLVRLASYELDIIDMCLEGYGLPSITDGGIKKAVDEKLAEKIVSECKIIKKQCDK